MVAWSTISWAQNRFNDARINPTTSPPIQIAFRNQRGDILLHQQSSTPFERALRAYRHVWTGLLKCFNICRQIRGRAGDVPSLHRSQFRKFEISNGFTSPRSPVVGCSPHSTLSDQQMDQARQVSSCIPPIMLNEVKHSITSLEGLRMSMSENVREMHRPQEWSDTYGRTCSSFTYQYPPMI